MFYNSEGGKNRQDYFWTTQKEIRNTMICCKYICKTDELFIYHNTVIKLFQ